MESTKKLSTVRVRMFSLAIISAACLMVTGYFVFAATPSFAADGQMVQFSSEDAQVPGYLVKPASGDKHAAVIVVHDSAGLNDDMKGVANKLAEAGYVALVPDLSRGAGAKGLGEAALTRPVVDLASAFAYLSKESSVDASKISAIGFGWGAWRVFKFAEDTPTLYRAVVYYGVTPTDDGLKNIKASILGQYAQYDFRITGNAPWTEKELGAKHFKYVVYPKTDHGFFTMTNDPENAEAAKTSWTKTLEFLK